MRILDKYILQSFLASFLTCILAFLFLYIIIDMFGHLDEIIKNQVSMSIIVQYYLTFLPTIFLQTSPFACLISIIFILGKINYHNELIAMRSSGLSIFKITFPIVLCGVVISLINFILSEKIISHTQKFSDKIKSQYIEKEDAIALVTLKNLAIYGFENRQLFINVFNSKENTIEGFTILEQDDRQNVTSKLFAKRAMWKDGYWQAYECLVYEFSRQGKIISSDYFKNLKLEISETPRDLLKQMQKIEYMNSRELLDYIMKLSSSGAEVAIRNLWIDFYQKIFYPFTCFIMVFIGIPTSMSIGRKMVGFSSIGIGIFVALLYFVFQAIAIALGKNGVFPAMASVLIAPSLFLCSAIYLILLSP